MDEYNIVIPIDMVVEPGPNLKIVRTSVIGGGVGKHTNRYYHIEASPEEVTVLVLKYGTDSVWKR